MKKLIEIIFIDKENEYIELTNDNINESKLKIQEYYGNYPNEQIWINDGNEIKNNKINLNKKIQVIIDEKLYQIYIKNINNDIIKLPRIKSNFTIYKIKLLIFSNFKLRPDMFNLTFNDIILENNCFISKYNILDNSLLKIILINKSGII